MYVNTFFVFFFSLAVLEVRPLPSAPLSHLVVIHGIKHSVLQILMEMVFSGTLYFTLYHLITYSNVTGKSNGDELGVKFVSFL